MIKLFKLLMLSRANLALVIFLSVLTGLANTLLLLILSNANKMQLDDWPMYLGSFVGGLLIFLILQRVLLKSIVIKSEKILRHVRIDLFRQVIKSRYSVFESLGHEKILSSFTHDATLLSQFWPVFVQLIVATITIATSLIYLGVLAPLALCIALAVILVGVLLYLGMTRTAKICMRNARDKQDSFLSIVNDLLFGMKELKIREKLRHDLYYRELAEITEQYSHESELAKMRYHDAGLIGTGLFFLLAGCVAFLFQSLNVIAGDEKIAFLVVLVYLMAPLTRVTASVPFISNALVSASRVLALKNLLEKEVEPSCGIYNEAKAADFLPEAWEAISFNQVSYEYGNDGDSHKFGLGPITLDINRGEVLFIVGGNGSGKSTFGKLLTGLYVPTGGSISIDDKQVDEFNLDPYRRCFSTVFSDFHLFERLTGLSQADRMEAVPLLKEFELSEDLIGDNSGQRFSSLSTGQQRRLALIFSALEDKQIYFFDEWAADQDPIYRERFYTSILPDLKAKGYTIIVITHDDRYFHIADRVVKIDKGQIISNTLKSSNGSAIKQFICS